MGSSAKQHRTDADWFARLKLAAAVADPGSLRILQAVRTVLAVLIALWAFQNFDRDVRLFAAIGAGFLMQCGEGATLREQQRVILACGGGMAAVALLATGFETVWWTQGAVLTGVAFLAYHLRQYVPRQAPIPIFGFTVGVLSTVLPGGWTRAPARAGAVLAALVIALVVHTFVFRRRRTKAFRRSARLYCELTAKELRSIARGDDAVSGIRRIERLLAFNRAIAESLAEGDERSAAERMLRRQYDVLYVLRLLHDLDGVASSAVLSRSAENLADAFDLLARRRDDEPLAVAAIEPAPAAGTPTRSPREFDPDYPKYAACLFALTRLRQVRKEIRGEFAADPAGAAAA